MKTKLSTLSIGHLLVPLAGGLWLAACVPTEPEDTKYSLSSYTAVTGDSGSLEGTWVLTSSKAVGEPEGWPALKSRAVFRLKSIEGSADQLELTYCHPDQGLEVSTADISADQLALNITTDSPAYTSAQLIEPFNIPDNNHLQKTVITAGGVQHEFQAVKISNDPAFGIGTVSVTFPVILRFASSQAAKCLLEVKYADATQQHLLSVSGTNGTPESATGQLRTEMVAGVNTTLMYSLIEDENSSAGTPGDPVTTNSVKSIAHSVRGSATAVYDVNGTSVVVGTTAFSITL